MAINPMQLLKMKDRLNVFNSQHPKVGSFLKEVSRDAVREGSVLELKVVSPDGKEYITNIRLTADDMQTVEMIKGMKN